MSEIPERRPFDDSSQAAAPPPPPPPRPPSPQRRPLPSPLAVITVGLGAFLIVLTLLAIQVRNGRDPALGPGPVTKGSGKSASGAQAGGTKAQQATKIVSQSSPVPP
jgi:hypothetical protein